MAVYSSEYQVYTHDADAGGNASVGALCRYLQDIAAMHAERIGYGMQEMRERASLWVLSRLEIEIDRIPRWRERVKVETWPSGTDRLFALRDWVVYGEDGEPAARATSAWVVLSSERRTPERVESIAERIDAVTSRRAIDHTAPKVSPFEGTDWSRGISAGYSDTDLNGHINNVRYIEWLLDTLPPELRRTHHLSKLAVNFVGEGRAGELMDLRSAEDGSRTEQRSFSHAASRRSDGTQLCRARSLWSRIGQGKGL